MNSQSRRYLNTISAAIVAILKTPAGVAIGYGLYELFAPLVRQAKSMKELADILTEAFRSYFSTLSLIPDSSMRNEAAKQLVISTSFLVLMIAVIVAAILMVLLEVIALWMLRIAGKGAGIVRVIHWIYCAVYTAFLILFLIQAGIFVVKGKPESYTLAGIIITAVIVVLVYLVFICYHKDIAMAMKTVGIECSTGTADRGFRRTHLSGLSILLGIPSLLLGISGCLGYEQAVRTTYEVYGTKYMLPEWSAIAVIVVLFWIFIKQIAISKCYSNLKKAR